MKKYSKFGESRKEKALTNDNFFNNQFARALYYAATKSMPAYP